jgi:hypothetical protein
MHLSDELKRLAELHELGTLSDAEFVHDDGFNIR